MSSDVEQYVQAADRDNTVKTYAAALRNFEEVWKGLLPATGDTVARYLAEHAETYRLSTLRLHLAALARWHSDNGFADPTRSPLVRKVLRGIRARHAVPQKRARPLQLDVLEGVSAWLLEAQASARKHGRRTELLRRSRDRALLLLGFWRAFRSDELVNMRIEEVQAQRGKGLTCRPRKTKTTDECEDRAFQCPALSRLCPVDAYLDWIEVSGLKTGPAFPSIDRWGHVSSKHMPSKAMLPLLRRILHVAGAEQAGSYHIRYGAYGGIQYTRVSDRFIALFSHFISCGTYEGLFILDNLNVDEPDQISIRPSTLHGDTHQQSYAAFAMSKLIGVQLMPRIRAIHNLDFFRPTKATKYENIDSLFKGTVDWKLIETHLPMMFRIGVSIKLGRLTPSTILRRLGTHSRKNKLYFAFQELGKVLRTIFLLKYISDVDMRRFINAETNKSEQFNDFLKLSFFGNGGLIAENVRHEQQKVMKFGHLMANILILYNVHDMERVIRELRDEGFPVSADVLKHLTPYRLGHVNMLGDYAVDRRRRVADLIVEPILGRKSNGGGKTAG